MAGLGHGPAQPREIVDERIAARNARSGLWLFCVYLVVYIGFVLLTAFAPQVMQITFASGLNVAILYGLGLIALAMVLALVYAWLCRPAADRSGRDSA